MSSQKILKEIIITSILCQSWEVIFCSSINCTRKTIFSLLLRVNSPNMQARPPFNGTLRVRLSTDNYAPHCRKVCKRCCRLLSQIYQLGSHALAPGAKRQTYQINLAVLATAGLFCSAEMTADLQPPIISFIWFAKWRQEREEEAGLLVAVQELVIVASGNCLALLTRNKELG